MFFPDPTSGELSEEFINRYEQTFEDPRKAYTSFAFDSVLALAHTLQHMIDRDEDYTDYGTFMKTLRDIKFKGVTGSVSF